MSLNNTPIRIAIDGPAASGKSTTARLVAQKLGFLYVDTGAMYRVVTLAVLEKYIDPEDEQAISKMAAKLNINQILLKSETRTLLNGRDVSLAIRMPDVNAIISQVSSHKLLRKIMIDKQRELAARGNVVMEGRDIGTVVLPEAEIKIFMQASLVERAHRRWKELAAKGIETSLEKLKSEISRRDELDATRENSPLKAAPDAVILDTSNLSIKEQVDFVVQLVELKIATSK